MDSLLFLLNFPLALDLTRWWNWEMYPFLRDLGFLGLLVEFFIFPIFILFVTILSLLSGQVPSTSEFRLDFKPEYECRTIGGVGCDYTRNTFFSIVLVAVITVLLVYTLYLIFTKVSKLKLLLIIPIFYLSILLGIGAYLMMRNVIYPIIYPEPTQEEYYQQINRTGLDEFHF